MVVITRRTPTTYTSHALIAHNWLVCGVIVILEAASTPHRLELHEDTIYI